MDRGHPSPRCREQVADAHPSPSPVKSQCQTRGRCRSILLGIVWDCGDPWVMETPFRPVPGEGWGWWRWDVPQCNGGCLGAKQRRVIPKIELGEGGRGLPMGRLQRCSDRYQADELQTCQRR